MLLPKMACRLVEPLAFLAVVCHFFSVVLGEIPTEPLAFFAGKPLTLVTFYGF